MKLLPFFAVALLACAGLVAQIKRYNGPRPDKADIPLLLQAGQLSEIENGEAQERPEKDATVYIVNGLASPVRTPVPEPTFLFKSDKINPERLSLFRMEIKNGNRFIAIPTNKSKKGPKPIFLMVNRLETGLWRVEVNEYLENGEYCLSPEGSNKVFCFSAY
jgi:hypothetical protein